ncbi:hypothetical protein [Streptacidiphilus sp. PB12-B1b]|uniref:hypothetical protein n=1 Tax=Streptacidiphilus sp. PB12-B1b TaxID=2705012 RepID=UPI0015FD9B54|nr:hypothetical protein [Streptacidiphilus sp. PB12-B1b]
MGLTEMMSSGVDAPVRRRRRALLGCLPLVLLLVLAVGIGFYLSDHPDLVPVPIAEGCTATSPDGIVNLGVQQTDNAGTISAVTVARNLPEQAATIALATAMQESKLQNLSGGDLDSIGLFQQRPSQGWGQASQIADPVYATDRFLDRLVAVPGYTELPLTVAAQDVQHSGYPDAYAQHEADATVLSGALTGRVPEALTCQVNSVGTAASPAAGAAAVSQRLAREFGSVARTKVLPLPADPAAGSPASASPSPSAAVVQAQLTVQARSGLTGSVQRGWAVASWAVAHCQDLHIASVRYAGQQWTASESTQGWLPLVAPSGSASAPVPGSSAQESADSGVSSSAVLISVAAE